MIRNSPMTSTTCSIYLSFLLRHSPYTTRSYRVTGGQRQSANRGSSRLSPFGPTSTFISSTITATVFSAPATWTDLVSALRMQLPPDITPLHIGMSTHALPARPPLPVTPHSDSYSRNFAWSCPYICKASSIGTYQARNELHRAMGQGEVSTASNPCHLTYPSLQTSHAASFDMFLPL